MKRHGFLLALLWGVLSCGSPSETLNVASKGEPKRERRILYYDSAAVQSHSYLDRGKVEPYMSLIYDIQTHDDFLDASVRMVKGTQVDTYLWHIGNGAEPPWNIPTDLLWDCFDSYEQVNDIVIRACHEQGLEVWGSVRMSDLHAAFRSRTLEELDDVFKTQHPEYLMAPMTDRQLPSELTEQRLWVSLDYTHPEVRQHRLDYIAKTAARPRLRRLRAGLQPHGNPLPHGAGTAKSPPDDGPHAADPGAAERHRRRAGAALHPGGPRDGFPGDQPGDRSGRGGLGAGGAGGRAAGGPGIHARPVGHRPMGAPGRGDGGAGLSVHQSQHHAGGRLGDSAGQASVSAGNAGVRRLLPGPGRGRDLPVQLQARADAAADRGGVRRGC